MGRLIDTDILIEIIDKHTHGKNQLDDDISCILEEVPTAYDPEKVEERLKELGDIKFSQFSKPLITVEDAIMIIKAGKYKDKEGKTGLREEK